MFRGVAWLAKIVAAGLIISFLSIWTTGYIVTSYVEAVLKQYELPLEVPPMAMSGLWGRMWGSDPLLTEGAAGSEGGGAGAADVRDQAAGTDDDAFEAMGGLGDSPPVMAGSDQDGAAATGGDSEDTGNHGGATGGGDFEDTGNYGGGAGEDVFEDTDGHGAVADGTETAMTTDELLGAKERMSESDKEQIFQMLMSQLPQEALQQISLYMEDGLTEAELTNIQQIMAQHLDKRQYDDMMEILKKY